jgi:tetratricopeptide (TPR) repeat protein
MTNKYLEKIAYLQEPIYDTIRKHYDKANYIEAPIRQLEEGMEEAYDHDREADDNDFSKRYYVQNMIAERSDALREHLGIDKQLEDNYLNTGRELLRIGNVEHDVDDYRDARKILQHIERVKRERNGWRALPVLAGITGVLGGGLAGAGLGEHRFGVPGAIIGGLSGAVAAGIAGNRLTHAAVDGKIDQRDKQIYDRHEDNLRHAYEVLRDRYKTEQK